MDNVTCAICGYETLVEMEAKLAEAVKPVFGIHVDRPICLVCIAVLTSVGYDPNWQKSAESLDELRLARILGFNSEQFYKYKQALTS